MFPFPFFNPLLKFVVFYIDFDEDVWDVHAILRIIFIIYVSKIGFCIFLENTFVAGDNYFDREILQREFPEQRNHSSFRHRLDSFLGLT